MKTKREREIQTEESVNLLPVSYDIPNGDWTSDTLPPLPLSHVAVSADDSLPLSSWAVVVLSLARDVCEKKKNGRNTVLNNYSSW